MLLLGGRQCDLAPTSRSIASQDRVWARQCLGQFKDRATDMAALRRLLYRGTSPFHVSRATDDEVIGLAGDLLIPSVWHVHRQIAAAEPMAEGEDDLLQCLREPGKNLLGFAAVPLLAPCAARGRAFWQRVRREPRTER